MTSRGKTTVSTTTQQTVRQSRRLRKKKEERDKLAVQKAKRKARKENQRQKEREKLKKLKEAKKKADIGKKKRPQAKKSAQRKPAKKKQKNDEEVSEFWIHPAIPSPRHPTGPIEALATLDGLCMRPGLKGTQTAGSLVAHSRGLIFTALHGGSIHISYRSIHYAFFLPFNDVTNGRVLLHFHFHHSTQIRTKTKDLQFYAKKIPTSLSESRHKRNRRMNSGLNKEFRNFIRAVRLATGGVAVHEGEEGQAKPEKSEKESSSDEVDVLIEKQKQNGSGKARVKTEKGNEDEEFPDLMIDEDEDVDMVDPLILQDENDRENGSSETKIDTEPAQDNQEEIRGTSKPPAVVGNSPKFIILDPPENGETKSDASLDIRPFPPPNTTRYSLRRLGPPPVVEKKRKKKSEEEDAEDDEEDADEDGDEDGEGDDEDDDEDDSDEDSDEEEEEEDDVEGGLIFEIPDEKRSFMGITHKATCWIQPTASCLIQLTERPFMVIPFDDIELACLERVGFVPPLKHFDMVFVRKDYLKRTDFKKAITTIHAIPTEALEEVMRILRQHNISYYKTSNNFRWKPLMEQILEDPEGFEEEGGWDVLNTSKNGEKETKHTRDLLNEDGDEDEDSEEDGEYDERDWIGEAETSDDSFRLPSSKKKKRDDNKLAIINLVDDVPEKKRKPTIKKLQEALRELKKESTPQRTFATPLASRRNERKRKAPTIKKEKTEEKEEDESHSQGSPPKKAKISSSTTEEKPFEKNKEETESFIINENGDEDPLLLLPEAPTPDQRIDVQAL